MASRADVEDDSLRRVLQHSAESFEIKLQASYHAFKFDEYSASSNRKIFNSVQDEWRASVTNALRQILPTRLAAENRPQDLADEYGMIAIEMFAQALVRVFSVQLNDNRRDAPIPPGIPEGQELIDAVTRDIQAALDSIPTYANGLAERAATRQQIVKPILKHKGWSNNDWATNAHVAFKTVTGYLDGKSTYPDTKKKLANALGLQPDGLPD